MDLLPPDLMRHICNFFSDETNKINIALTCKLNYAIVLESGAIDKAQLTSSVLKTSKNSDFLKKVKKLSVMDYGDLPASLLKQSVNFTHLRSLHLVDIYLGNHHQFDFLDCFSEECMLEELQIGLYADEHVETKVKQLKQSKNMYLPYFTRLHVHGQWTTSCYHILNFILSMSQNNSVITILDLALYQTTFSHMSLLAPMFARKCSQLHFTRYGASKAFVDNYKKMNLTNQLQLYDYISKEDLQFYCTARMPETILLHPHVCICESSLTVLSTFLDLCIVRCELHVGYVCTLYSTVSTLYDWLINNSHCLLKHQFVQKLHLYPLGCDAASLQEIIPPLAEQFTTVHTGKIDEFVIEFLIDIL